MLSDEFESAESFPPPSRTVVRIPIFESLPPADDADGFSLDPDGRRRRVRPWLVRIGPGMVEGGGGGGSCHHLFASLWLVSWDLLVDMHFRVRMNALPDWTQ